MATKEDTKGHDTKAQDAKNTNQTKTETGWEPGKTGQVQDPENDGRLKANREAGKTLGTTEHSAEAPHVATKA